MKKGTLFPDWAMQGTGSTAPDPRVYLYGQLKALFRAFGSVRWKRVFGLEQAHGVGC